MPAVVRVKRRIDEEPLGAFVLNGKKRRINDGGDSERTETSKEEISTILKFAGTVNSQDDSATTQLARLTKVEARELVQKARKPSNITERTRQEMRQSLHENRFKVVNCFRKTLENEENIESSNNKSKSKEITIVDIEKQTIESENVNSKSFFHNAEVITASTSKSSLNTNVQNQQIQQQQQLPSDSDTGYVYDLYLPENEQQAENVDLMDDNHLSYKIRAFDDFIYEDRFNNDDDDYDSEDSNHENCVGNDYPDEDDDNSDIDDDSIINRKICRAVKKFNFDNSDDSNSLESLSSDDEYNPYTKEDYVLTADSDEERFLDDVNRYGSAYARYKARILKEVNKVDSDLEENYD